MESSWLPPEIARPLNRFLERYLHELMPNLEPGQAWQSSHDLHRLAGLDPLVECIDVVAEAALESLKVGSRVIEITACWATVRCTRPRARGPRPIRTVF